MTADPRALSDMSYGLFIVSSFCDGKINALIANSVFQVTALPPKLAIAINKESLTHEYIKCSGKFCVQPLKQEGTTLPFIGNFGFRTGRTFNKFEKIDYKLNENGLPIVLENTLAAIEVNVDQMIDLGTHTMFIGPVLNANVISEGKPLTYDYYQCTLRGKTPKGATTFQEIKQDNKQEETK